MKSGFITINMNYTEFSVLMDFSIKLIHRLKQSRIGEYTYHFYRDEVLNEKDWDIIFLIFSDKKTSNKYSITMKPQSFVWLKNIVDDIKKDFYNEVITIKVPSRAFNLLIDIHSPSKYTQLATSE